MQTTHKISGDAAGGFAAYLTSTSSRGDYYAHGPEDDAGDDEAGRWHGSPQALARLGLERGGRVERSDLVALMRGASPRDGSEIRAVGGGGSRVAGIDLTFSAPKSVSALWAVSGPYRRAQIMAAHRGAVASALGRIEREVAVVRRREGGMLRSESARSLVAGEFVHTASRLTRDQERGGVPDPQLHSHVVVVAAERQDGRFAAVDSRELYRSARANGAWYRAELAWNLGELGVEVRGRSGRGGRYFEVAGVPQELSRRWSARSVEVEAAAQRFRQRYGRDPRGGELGALTVATRGTKTAAAAVDVDGAWRAVGEEYGLGPRVAEGLFADAARHEVRPLDRELLDEAVRERSMVSERDLRAQAIELSAGVARPSAANDVIGALAASGELVELEGGMWTSREQRELERATVARVRERASEPAAPLEAGVGERAVRAAEQRLGGRVSAEQRRAVDVLAGRGGVGVLVGQAGTGKGVVIATAADAWRQSGHQVIGTAVAGATAKRLAADAGLRSAMTTDALLHRHQTGELVLDRGTVVVMDEAGMADTRRLAGLVEATDRSNSKLVLVGDSAQLSPIGAGGLFDRLRREAPSAELTEVHRAREAWERQAWARLRSGQAERALGEYRARGRLHVNDTRADAIDRIVGDWDRARQEHPPGRTVMLTDASNEELDRLNARAQERRARAGELGEERVALNDRPYGLATGDEVLFCAQLRPPGLERVENGTRGQVIDVHGEEQRVVVRTEEPTPREVAFSAREFADVRLAYAQHVYKAQGMTVDRALVLTGGWQTDRERAYVALSRARDRSDIYVSRDDLGEEGLDAGAIDRLGQRMSHSRAQQASLTRDEVTRGREPERESQRDESLSVDREVVGRESEVGRILREQVERERDRALGLGAGIE